jgi:hypothetical protein
MLRRFWRQLPEKQNSVRNILLSALCPEKLSQHLPAFISQQAAPDFRTVIQLGERKFHHRSDSPGLGVGGAVKNPADSRLHYCAQTHGAWLQRNVQIASNETIIFPPGAGLPNGQDFRMGCRVILSSSLIEAPAQNFSVSHENSADRDLSPAEGFFGLGQGKTHKHFLKLHWSRSSG